LNVALPRSVYASFMGKPVSLQLTLAVSEGQPQSETSILFPSSRASTPSDGICSASSSYSEGAGYTSENVAARCRFPLRQPYLRIRPLMRDPGCDSGSENWNGSLTTGLADFAINPVWGAATSMGATYSASGISPRSCPAVGVTFTEYRLERRLQVSLTIPDYHLPQLSASQQ